MILILELYHFQNYWLCIVHIQYFINMYALCDNSAVVCHYARPIVRPISLCACERSSAVPVGKVTFRENVLARLGVR